MLSLLFYSSSIKLSHITPSFIILQQHWHGTTGCSSNSLHLNEIPQFSFKSSFIDISSNHLTSLPSNIFSQLTLLQSLFPSIHPLPSITQYSSQTSHQTLSLILTLETALLMNCLFIISLSFIISFMLFIDSLNLIILYPSIMTQLSSQIPHS